LRTAGKPATANNERNKQPRSPNANKTGSARCINTERALTTLLLKEGNMAVSESKLSVHRAQPQYRAHNSRNIFHFPPAQRKLVEAVEFYTASGYHSITVKFQDKTCLNFIIDMGLTVTTDYSDWKTGNQRVLRRWPPARCYDWRTQPVRTTGKRKK
jgi:hypothetical protein